MHDFWSLHLKGSLVCARSQTKDERSRHSPLALSFTDLNVEATNKQTIKSNQTKKNKAKQTNKQKTIIIITAKKGEKGKKKETYNCLFFPCFTSHKDINKKKGGIKPSITTTITARTKREKKKKHQRQF